jgi:uridine kinase
VPTSQPESPPTASRAQALGRIVDHLVARSPGHPLRVGVDGITAAGKTTLAGELVLAVQRAGRPAIHLSMDGFHHRRERRYRQGLGSGIGYYEDAFDLTAFCELVLRPLGPGGDLCFAPRVIDLEADLPVQERATADPESILFVDGSFLQRDELAGHWDEVIFVDTDFDEARIRGARRDATMFGGVQQATERYRSRYHEASRIYLESLDPKAAATIVLENNQPERPILKRIGGRPGDQIRVFSYGTLQQPEVQMSSFGRLLEGTADRLPGYTSGWVRILDPEVIAASGSDRHPIVQATGAAHDSVEGTVFVLSPEELAGADTYEVSDYRRVPVTLASGTEAWVYVGTSSTTKGKR